MADERRRNKPSVALRNKIIGELELARARGLPDHRIAAEYAEKYKLKPRTIKEYLGRADLLQARRIQRRRPELVARQAARLETAMEVALSNRELVVHREYVTDAKGVPRAVRRSEWVRKPNLTAYLAAVSGLSKLLGLDAPERHVHIHGQIEKVFQAVVLAIEKTVEDPVAREEVYRELAQIASAAEDAGDLGLSSVPTGRRMVGAGR